MRSINPFLQHQPDKRIDSLTRVISVLLQGIALHSFCHDEAEFETFQRALQKLRQDIALVDDEDSALLLAGSAIRILEEHHAAAELTIASRQNDLEAVIGQVSELLLEVGRPPEALAMELRESERDIASARNSADTERAQTRLTRCLENIRVLRLRRNEGASFSPGAWGENEVDAATGLPDSRVAMDAIVAAWDRREDYTAAVFAIRSLDVINMRYGFEAGDEVLRVASKHVTGIFAGKHRLFRWRGPFLLGLIEKKSLDYSRISLELQRLPSTRLQHSIVRRDRDVILPISMNCTLLPLMARSIDDLIRNLDQTAATRLRQEA